MTQESRIKFQLGLIKELVNVINVKIALIEDVTSEGLVQDVSKPVSLEGSPFEQSDIDTLKAIIFETAENIATDLNKPVIKRPGVKDVDVDDDIRL